jgi:hypothetical protein
MNLCQPCKRRGRLAAAKWTVNGEGMCDDCYTGKEPEKPTATLSSGAGLQQSGPHHLADPISAKTLPQKEEKKMPAKKNIDWKAVQAERDMGAPVVKLQAKYQVSGVTIYHNTTGNGTKPAGGGKNGKPPKRAGGVTPPSSALTDALDSLRKEREELNGLIEGLERIAERRR